MDTVMLAVFIFLAPAIKKNGSLLFDCSFTRRLLKTKEWNSICFVPRLGKCLSPSDESDSGMRKMKL